MRQYSRAFRSGQRVRALAGTVSALDPFSNGIMRLVPTNRRAAWGGNPIFPRMNEPALVEQLAYSLGKDVGELLTLPKPFFHGSSHPHNLLLFGKQDHCLTDFSNSFLPGVVDVEYALALHMGAVCQLDGFGGDVTYFAFLGGLANAFAEAKILPRALRAKVLLASDPKSALKKLAERIRIYLEAPQSFHPGALHVAESPFGTELLSVFTE